MLYTVEHLPIPVSLSALLMEVDFKRKKKKNNKRTIIGVAECFRDANFPRRAVSENRNTKEVVVCLYMIHLFKTNYQQKKKAISQGNRKEIKCIKAIPELPLPTHLATLTFKIILHHSFSLS